jgi:hypothetical protein
LNCDFEYSFELSSALRCLQDFAPVGAVGIVTLEVIMKSLVSVLALSGALAMLPAAAFAQADAGAAQAADSSSWWAARADTDRQLLQLQRVGYRATSAGNQRYPLDMQRALARVYHPVPDRSAEERAAMEARVAQDTQAGRPVSAFFVKTGYYLKGENTF